MNINICIKYMYILILIFFPLFAFIIYNYFWRIIQNTNIRISIEHIYIFEDYKMLIFNIKNILFS